MAVAEPRSELEVRNAIREERQRLAASLDELRGGLGRTADIRARVGSALPLVAAAAFGAGFVSGGGIGASVRYVLRRRRDR